MGLINVPDIQDNDLATQTLWNSRFATIVAVINGNLDAANLSNDAVTTPKIANLAVTEGKVADKAVAPGKLTDLPDWTEATMTGGWTSYDGGTTYNTGGYYKDHVNTVHLKGLVKSGTGTIFTLPAGFRPIKTLILATTSNNLFGQVRVGPTGAITMHSGTNTWISLDGIVFRAEQ